MRPAKSPKPGKLIFWLQVAVLLFAASICLVFRRWSLPEYGYTLSISGSVIILIAILNLAGAVRGFHVRSKKAFSDFIETRILRYAAAVGVLPSPSGNC
ncbi:MAG: hypothetical protein PVJ07_00470 [Anaerolineales bacterium]